MIEAASIESVQGHRMVAIASTDLEDMRRITSHRRSAHWTKTQINAALQAIEDAMTAGNVGARTVKVFIGAAIETAAPGVFNAAEKDDLFVIWCRFNVARGGFL